MKKNPAGFTLVEALLYISLSSFILLAISLFILMLLQARVKNKSISEVEQQGSFVMRTITQTLRNAQSVNSPGPGQSSGQLSIHSPDALQDPVVFDAGSNTLTETFDGGQAMSLTSPSVALSNASFTNLSQAGSPASIQVRFTLSFKVPSTLGQYVYSANFESAATLGQP